MKNNFQKRQRRKKRILRKIKKSIKLRKKDFSGEIKIATRAPSTNFSHSQCYANKYIECDDKITKEHFLSKTLLENFEFIYPKDIEYIKISQPIKPINLSTNCLCSFHNSSLSPLDSYIESFFNEFTKFNSVINSHVKFFGKNIEKWFAKCMLGYVSSGRIIHNNYTYSVNDINPLLLDFLFRDSDLPNEFGLYYLNSIGAKFNSSKSLILQTLFLHNKVSGISVSFSGFKFYFILAPKKDAFRNLNNLEFILHHPHAFLKKDTNSTIELIW